jgi:hypothetical protein
LRELARNHISDVGDIDTKNEFHKACVDEFYKLTPELKNAIGTMRIRDALYLIIDFNRVAGDLSPWSPVPHASTYVAFLRILADIVTLTNAHTIAFRGDGSRTVDENYLRELIKKLQQGLVVFKPSSFTSRNGVVNFTVAQDGSIVP